MSTQTFHYFLTYATFIDVNTGEIGNVTATQGYGDNRINKSGLKTIASEIEKFIKSQDPSRVVRDIKIISVSYLGEMTEAEFNS
ncbi:hypothetical protein [Acinetobacter calcoaceticus]|uniref:Uncharacterized protein n=1 Tax=Acinetobacter calcoaceticus TaxID=471 RepID=A0ABD5AKY2_ACICA|nr:hypothetical protein [Acinetobacter calcoaceticus]MDP9803238.1 hypothetical protein [Acinetobacter calcoaceticus]